MVMYAPGGIASLIMMNVRVAALQEAATGSGAGTPALTATALLMLVGAAALVELVYHLQLARDDRLDAALPRPHARHATDRRAGWARSAVTLIGFAAFEFVRRRFALDWGRIQGEIEATMSFKEPTPRSRGRRSGGAGSEHGRHERPTPAVELKDLRKSLRQDRDHPRHRARGRAGRARRDHRPERRRQVDALQSHQRPLRADQRRDPAQRQAHRRPDAVRDQPPRPGAQLPDHQHLRRACRCSRTCAAACSGRWATATRSGSSWPT